MKIQADEAYLIVGDRTLKVRNVQATVAKITMEVGGGSGAIAASAESLVMLTGILTEVMTPAEPSFVEGNVSVPRDGGGDGDPARRKT